MCSTRTSPALCEIKDGDVLCEGSIVAVVGSKTTFWLAHILSECGSTNLRWTAEWLEQQPTGQKQKKDGNLYTFAEDYDEAVIWRDTVLCDVTSVVVAQDDGSWLLPPKAAEEINFILSQQLNTDNSHFSHQSHCSLLQVRSSESDTPSYTWTDDVVHHITSRCSEGIEKVNRELTYTKNTHTHIYICIYTNLCSYCLFTIL